MRKSKGILRTIGMAFLSLMIGFALPTAVYAGSAQSSFKYYTVYGYNYRNYSGVTTGSYNGTSYANSWTTGQTDLAATQVPAGYIGAQARLFDSNGSVVATTPYTYNDYTTATHSSDFASADPAISGRSYYGYGITAAYNGNGYTYCYSNKSPYQTAP